MSTPQHQPILQHQLGVLQLIVIHTLSTWTWTWRQILLGKGSVPQDYLPTAPAHSHFRCQSPVQVVTCAFAWLALNSARPFSDSLDFLEMLTEPRKTFIYQIASFLQKDRTQKQLDGPDPFGKVCGEGLGASLPFPGMSLSPDFHVLTQPGSSPNLTILLDLCRGFIT